MSGPSIVFRTYRRTPVRHFWVVLGTAAITGCASVSSVEPMGERPKEVTAQVWQGTWIHQEHPVTVRVSDPRAGLLDVAWVEEKEGALKLESYRIALRESAESTFANTKDPGQPGRYLWALVKREDEQIVVWTPDAVQCAKRVQAGVLAGTVGKGGDVTLGKLSSKQIKQLASPGQGSCLRWTEPLVFFRVGK